jgi:PAS domain S-box-containing protein
MTKTAGDELEGAPDAAAAPIDPRVYAVVTAVRQVIVRTTSEGDLFERACRIAVDQGRFRFAWVGAVDRDRARVVPVARAGHEAGYLDDIRVDIDESPYARGPSSTAVRDGQPVVANDVERDPRMSPWRDAALARGYRSSAAFPIRRAGAVVAVLGIYSGEANRFDAEEVRLFSDMTDDIGFALDALDAAARRRQAEQRLLESEERYRALVEQADDAIFLADDTARFLDANPAACKLLGYTRDELRGMRIPDVCAPDDVVDGLPERFRRLLRVGTTLEETRLRRKDGALVDVDLRARRMNNGQLHAIVRDITERRQLQAQLLLADRMASMGRLAAGVAHEINNPLAYVVLSLELVANRIAEARGTLGERALGDVRASIEEARGGVERVRQIVRALSSFSRGDEAPVGAVDVACALDAAVNIAGSKIRHRATLVRDYRATRHARANEFRLGQVLLNLLVNAADAIPEDAPTQNTITLRSYSDDERVFVEVIDTGSGIAPEIVDRIFDPFFTTKPIGTGTGLGLAICHTLMTAYGGGIAVESCVGRGTTMRIWLPVAESAATLASPAPAAVPRGGRILVVDDEPVIGRTIRHALAQHEVTLTQQACDALDLCRKQPFDCIVSDLMMPGMSGMDLYDALTRDRTGLERRVVFITGGAVTDRAREFLAQVSNPWLEKPFELSALAEVVERVIGETPGAPHRS